MTAPDMPNSSIFLVDRDNRLTELTQSPYESEDLFQTLLADHPTLLRLAAGQDGSLLLIKREQAVPDESGSSGRWSLDHLFLDRQGVPVLVEVKQASDTRARREVVAQMLDYAANGVAYWPIERIIAAYGETARLANNDADSMLSEFLDGGDPETYWKQVEANLRSGRIRMLFVADRIPKELARIVEFLNEQMRPAEVLALEMEQFVNASGLRTVVPRLIGATERAQSAKSISVAVEPISQTDWLAALEIGAGLAARLGAQRALEWFSSQGLKIVMNTSQDSLAVRAVAADGKERWPFLLRRSTARLELNLGSLAYTVAFQPESARFDLINRMRNLPSSGVRATENLRGWPSLPLSDLTQDKIWLAVSEFAANVLSDVARS